MPTIGGTATLTGMNLLSITGQFSINAYTNFSLFFSELDIETNKAQHLANLNKTIIIQDDTLSMYVCYGEVRNFKYIHAQKMIIYNVSGISKKAELTATNYVPVINYPYQLIKHIEYVAATPAAQFIDNDTALWGSNDTYLVTVAQEGDLDIRNYTPNHALGIVTGKISSFTTATRALLGAETAAEFGGPENLYFDTGGLVTSNIYRVYAALGSSNLGCFLRFHVPIKVSTAITKLELSLDAYFIQHSNFPTHGPEIWMQYVGANPTYSGEYHRVYAYDISDTDYGSDHLLGSTIKRSPLRSSTISIEDADTVSTDLDDYIDVLTSNVGSGEFNLAEIDFFIFGGDNATDAAYLVQLVKANLKVTYNADQQINQGRYYINSDTATSITMNGAESWEDRHPLLDGVSVGDKIYIAKNSRTQLSEMITASGIGWSLSRNVGSNDAFRSIISSYSTVRDFVQAFCDMWNGYWWVEWNGSVKGLYIRDPDNATAFDPSTGAGTEYLSEKHIYHILNSGYEIEFSSFHMRTSIYAIGDGMQTESNSTGVTLDGGNEAGVIRATFSTQAELDAYIAQQVIIAGQAKSEAIFAIVPSHAIGGVAGATVWASLGLGKVTNVDLPIIDTNNLSHILETIEYRYGFETGAKEMFILKYKRRIVSV